MLAEDGDPILDNPMRVVGEALELLKEFRQVAKNAEQAYNETLHIDVAHDLVEQAERYEMRFREALVYVDMVTGMDEEDVKKLSAMFSGQVAKISMFITMMNAKIR